MADGELRYAEEVSGAALVSNLCGQLPAAQLLGTDVKTTVREAILPRLRLPPHHHQETHYLTQ